MPAMASRWRLGAWTRVTGGLGQVLEPQDDRAPRARLAGDALKGHRRRRVREQEPAVHEPEPVAELLRERVDRDLLDEEAVEAAGQRLGVQVLTEAPRHRLAAELGLGGHHGEVGHLVRVLGEDERRVAGDLAVGGARHRRDHVAGLVERHHPVRVVEVLVDVGVAVRVVDAAADLDGLLRAQRADVELRPLRHGHVLRLRQGRLVGRRRGGDGVRRQVLDDHRLLAAAAEVVELDRVGGPLDEEAAEAGAGLGLEVGAGVVLGGEGGVPRQTLVVHRDLDAGGDALAGDVEAPALVAAERPVDHVGGRLLHHEVEAAQLLVGEPGLARVLAHEPLHHRQEGERTRHGERAATYLRARLVLRHPIPSSVVTRPPCSASRRTIPYPWNAPVCPARPSRGGTGWPTRRRTTSR